MITEVMESRFFEKIETFLVRQYQIETTFLELKKDDLLSELELNDYVNKGDVIVKLKVVISLLHLVELWDTQID